MSETGSVKFTCEHIAVELAPFAGFDELQTCRRRLLQLRCLGADSNGIGFGNISVRDGTTNSFYITGSGTGGLPAMTWRHCAYVTGYDFERNCIRCEGLTIASSESLTHAAIYEADTKIAAVIHGHDAALWRRLCESGPATSVNVEYGTPAMAREVQRLFRDTNVQERRKFAMGGHQDGVIAFGGTLNEAFAALTTAAE